MQTLYNPQGHGERSKATLIQSQVGKPRHVGEIILMPLVCLLSAQVAQRTHPEVFAAANRIVLKLSSSHSQAQVTMNLTPMGFSMHTNPFGCAAAFLSKAIKNLQPWELILCPGAIQQLAQRYDIPNLGDKI